VPEIFCAWSEVLLGGRWHVFDACHNTPRIGRIPVVRGRDAADVAMITAFGDYRLRQFKVWTDDVDRSMSECDLSNALRSRPKTEALVPAPSSGILIA
jgi:hypothetical protein